MGIFNRMNVVFLRQKLIALLPVLYGLNELDARIERHVPGIENLITTQRPIIILALCI